MSVLEAVDFSKLPQGINTPTGKLIANVETNIRRHLPQLRIYQPQDREIAICAGGPSLTDTWDELQELVDGGAATVAVNGAYKHLLDHETVPGMFCMLDAREWNKRFVDETRPETRFFIASQCDPAVFDSLAEQGREVFIWHAPIPIPKGEREKSWGGGAKIYSRYYLGDRNYLIVPGGVTCTAKVIMLVYWLGFRKVHVFGFDSCWMDGKDHAYDQPENRDKNIKFEIAGRTFNCAPWMAHQADSFFKLVPNLPDNLQLQVHGDGLIAHGLKMAAEQLAA